MKNIKQKLFSKKFLIYIASMVFFGVLLRLFYSQVLDLKLSIDRLDMANLSFLTILALFKGTLRIMLDEYMPYRIPMGSHKDTTVLSMDNKSDNNPSKPGVGGSSKQSSSSGSSSRTSIGGIIAEENLSDNMHGTLKGMLTTLHELQTIKRTKKVCFILGKEDNLLIDVPTSMADSEASEIANKVSDLDATYSAHADRYKKLMELDKRLYENRLTPNFNNSYKTITDKHKTLFEKE